MVTPVIRSSLTKQGYRVVGSHSGVKLCRWTKSMVRNRGGCYKHTFYGIQSHNCMEATPSLACANKCIFCWRHHANPVGTKWTWNMDDPQFVVDNLIIQHKQMIKIMKGIQGANPERLAEAQTIQHCALSLVGEPIMYPRINEVIDILHEKNISTFLVTNAQFPLCIQNLVPVTQLYVSIDASTPETLKKIDRPLFADFWERLLQSIDFLKQKRQRTVYRLTLVKNYNNTNVCEYSKLIERGEPSFVEIKAVTYCGQDESSEVRIHHTPYHYEVVEFSKKLLSYISDYDIACEHEHSNSVLLAHKKFYFNDTWNTWINYKKFSELYQKWKESDRTYEFTEIDYSAPTPGWALHGSNEKGFDPTESRFVKHR
ncbi:S-adenosyl-L-methionine-dependent tRNA 4-demethylwyosine synthase [Thelohanellus kitauei]|uniref:S-adenosyl-L-methionine-dependent tRNA 4-demethylwyosine synthase n=1 Tax=Thelohanellus kitauei TaxID=669202 RepID=A0A0C2ICF2_THEKT|nr:S-adenosyl-L-methionine-dependent tRNA 4-demethylwyosine synthase [Thelohanellus kitauei]